MILPAQYQAQAAALGFLFKPKKTRPDSSNACLAFRKSSAAVIAARPEYPPKEWLRAGIGALLGLFLAGWLTSMAYGPGIALHLLGPLAASAVLVFAVHSGPLAQPWPVLGSYALAGAVGLAMRQGFGPELWVAAVALGISILVMCLLRCLHPRVAGWP